MMRLLTGRSQDDPHALGEAFTARARACVRPLCVLAHHDDEIPVAGLLQRLGPGLRIVWVTNSDGLYFESDLPPPEYGELRTAEGMRSAAALGLDASSVRNLAFSEVEIYRCLSRLHSGAGDLDSERALFERMREAVRDAVFEIEPDLVVSLAWQGGQPEHDLTHFFTRLALRELARERSLRPGFFHFPAYEYTYALAMRFHPLYRGQRMRLRLTRGELERKLELLQAYPSQVRLFERFRWAFRLLFYPLGLLSGGPRSAEGFLAIEEFGPVPEIDYSAPPHRLDFCTYMFDDFEGVPVTFARSVRPLVRSFL
ncbi:MAG: PIG-L family deacetylase [Deltaproteobacteria bacterium]|nr:PIG-L family deacetylase [Deltaproteobacteria bacterium]